MDVCGEDKLLQEVENHRVTYFLVPLKNVHNLKSTAEIIFGFAPATPDKCTRSENSNVENRPLEDDSTQNRKPLPEQRRRKHRPKVITEHKPQTQTRMAEKNPAEKKKKRKYDIKSPKAPVEMTEKSNSSKKRSPKKKSNKGALNFDEMSSGEEYSVRYSGVSCLESRSFFTRSISKKNFQDCGGIKEVKVQSENAEKGIFGKDFSPCERPTKKRSKSSTKARDLVSLTRITERIMANSSSPEQPESFIDALKAQIRLTLPTKKRTKRNSAAVRYPMMQQSYPLSVDDIEKQLKSLDINRETTGFANLPKNEIVPYKGSGMVMPFGPIKRIRQRAKVDLDEETTRVWKLLLGNINTNGIDGTDEDKAKWWEEERKVFNRRIDSFIARMHLVQGDRRFSKWKGSVLDSVVGVYLTQNVSDHLSSSAFMSLAAHYPLKSKNRYKACIEPDEPEECVSENREENHGINHTKHCMGKNDNAVVGIISPEQFADSSTHQTSDKTGSCLDFDGEELENRCDILGGSTSLLENLRVDEVEMSLENDNNSRRQKMEKPIGTQQNFRNHSEEIPVIVNDATISDKECGPYIKTDVDTSELKSGRVRKEKIDDWEWDKLRKQTESKGRRQREENTIESLDWEAIRCADVDEVANAIKERGMNNKLAQRIKDFLNRLVKDNGDTDLEWLRDVPPDKAKDYLLSFYGLGLKSVECVRLLTLHQLAFPVDTNVGRIAVRLGWVPLQPLPESIQLHLLELYPMQEKIQKYLWPRLCKLDQRTLYELHYQMITFGKVFCTKSKPNCNACPMRGDCRHFASAFASARLALPGTEEKRVIISTENGKERMNPSGMNERPSFPDSVATKESKEQSNQSEPIIEEPSTPEPECAIGDIEDFPPEDPDEIPTIKLKIKEFTQNLHNYMHENMELRDGDVSKALVSVSSDYASIPMPKLKNVSRLRTEHHVYELPDTHPLLERMEKREPGDPSPYLLAIWTPGETPNSFTPPENRCSSRALGKLCNNEECFSCNNTREKNSKTVRGTLLIPCKTAMRGRFPLNGTYFQVNEVFADHDSSLNPINVPRDWIWNLKRRTVYFGTSIPTIFRGLTTQDIQHCFSSGYVCVRGFDQKSRAPRPLMARLHFAVSKWKRTRDPKSEE